MPTRVASTSGELFARACRALRVTQLMGRVGSALDNATAESWMLSPVAYEAVLAARAADTAPQPEATWNQALRSPQRHEPDPGWHQGADE